MGIRKSNLKWKMENGELLRAGVRISGFGVREIQKQKRLSSLLGLLSSWTFVIFEGPNLLNPINSSNSNNENESDVYVTK